MPPVPPHTLVFVDRPLAVAVAAKLVGVLTTHTNGFTTRTSLNWLISAGMDEQNADTRQVDIREMLPEHLLYYVYPHIDSFFPSINTQLLDKLATGPSGGFIPGDVLSVCGTLRLHNIDAVPPVSPFDPVELNLPTTVFHGEVCIPVELKDSNYTLPVFIPENAKYQVAFCHNQPVEITGIVRWAPPYSPGGARSLNLAIRIAALWLR
jgi:hypothetical protein